MSLYLHDVLGKTGLVCVCIEAKSHNLQDRYSANVLVPGALWSPCLDGSELFC